MDKTFRMITAERVAMLMLAIALALWGVIELCSSKHVASVPTATADTVIIEKADTVIPVDRKTRSKKGKKKSATKKSTGKSPRQYQERDYFEDQLNE